ncbi:lariat debranching enzyme [Trichomonascus vanleenenianus]|uniref:RNA lariat debranching enzyme n=1 Tax=Trichomonascus vanleenenianus TaxID=2268995 RepID=UPI003ECB343C
MKTLNIVFQGCCHSQLNKIYESIQETYEHVDLVLIGGDFQAVRTPQDLNCMSVPPKYRRLGDFHEYYYGTRKAPYLTIFIGGNHEASNYLQELHYGGWVAPNIYYLGDAGVVNFGGIRIGGISGIFNDHHYEQPHFERIPLNRSSERSIYHIRQFDVLKLGLLRGKIEIMMSHDWPQGIIHFGDKNWLYRIKKHLQSDAESGRLGSPPAMELLKQLRPMYWLSAHLHVRFQALVEHERTKNEDEIELDIEKKNEDEIDLDLGGNEDEIGLDLGGNDDEIELDIDETTNDDEIELDLGETPMSEEYPKNEESNAKESTGYPQTAFLALDKCLPRREFIEMIRIPAPESGSNELCYDKEWLAVTRATNKFYTANKLPSSEDLEAQLRAERQWIEANIKDLKIPLNFEPLTPQLAQISAETGIDIRTLSQRQPPVQINNQTQQFCDLLQIERLP